MAGIKTSSAKSAAEGGSPSGISARTDMITPEILPGTEMAAFETLPGTAIVVITIK